MLEFGKGYKTDGLNFGNLQKKLPRDGFRVRLKSQTEGRAGPLGAPRIPRNATLFTARPAVAPYLFRRSFSRNNSVQPRIHANENRSSVNAPTGHQTVTCFSFRHASSYLL